MKDERKISKRFLPGDPSCGYAYARAQVCKIGRCPGYFKAHKIFGRIEPHTTAVFDGIGLKDVAFHEGRGLKLSFGFLRRNDTVCQRRDYARIQTRLRTANQICTGSALAVGSAAGGSRTFAALSKTSLSAWMAGVWIIPVFRGTNSYASLPCFASKLTRLKMLKAEPIENRRTRQVKALGAHGNVEEENLRRFSEQQADKNHADSHTRCSNAHVDYGCEQIPKQAHFTASSMIRFSSSASCSESLRPLREAVRNFGSDRVECFFQYGPAFLSLYIFALYQCCNGSIPVCRMPRP